MAIEVQRILKLVCLDCGWDVETWLDTDPAEEGKDAAWDHLGKYDEKPNGHTIDGTVIYRFRYDR